MDDKVDKAPPKKSNWEPRGKKRERNEDEHVHKSNLKDIPESERFGVMAEKTMNAKRAETKSTKCLDCWWELALCTCSIFDKSAEISIENLEVLVFMHFKEYGRCSNTGKVISTTFPKHVRLLFLGDKQDEKYIHSCFFDEKKKTFVLFPESTSLSSEDVKKELESIRIENNKNKNEEKTDKHEGTKVCVILLDGTWNEARSLLHYLKKNVLGDGKNDESTKKMKSVALKPSSISEFSRSQSKPDRICTLEALAVFLKEMGEKEKNVETLMKNFRANMSATHGERLQEKVAMTQKIINSELERRQKKSKRDLEKTTNNSTTSTTTTTITNNSASSDITNDDKMEI